MMKSIAGKLSSSRGDAGSGAAANAVARTRIRFSEGLLEAGQNQGHRGSAIRAWASPKLTPANYHALLIDPAVFYPEPRPSEQVSAEALQQILAYSNDLLKRTLSKDFNVVDRAGPGVVRIRGAVTSVAAKGEGLKPYQLVPIAFVATAAKRAATGAPQRAFIIIEVEGTDSVTGELLAQRVRVGTGERLAKIADQQTITLETVKPLLDELAARAFPELSKYVKPK
jgi:hypothetical protein